MEAIGGDPITAFRFNVYAPNAYDEDAELISFLEDFVRGHLIAGTPTGRVVEELLDTLKAKALARKVSAPATPSTPPLPMARVAEV